MIFTPPNIDYDMYAKMDYWTFQEALSVVVSYKLINICFKTNTEYDGLYDAEFEKLKQIMFKSIEIGSIQGTSAIYDTFGSGLILLERSYLIPCYFTKWVETKGYSLPSELCNIPQSQISISSLEDKIEFEFNNYLAEKSYTCNKGANNYRESSDGDQLDSNNYYRPVTNPPTDLNEISTVHEKRRRDQSGIPKNCIKSSKAALEMTDKRWELNRQMKAHIKDYVDVEANKPGCKCLPHHMVDKVFNLENSDGNMLIASDILSEKAALKYIKTLYADNNILRTCKGHPPKNTCPLHVNKR